MKKNRKEIYFNYCIGHIWPNTNGNIGTYTICNNGVHYGNGEDAKDTLDYVRSQSPDEDWKVFALIKVNDIE